MIKLVAMYKKPEDAKAFDDHYFNVHMPLASKMPGLRKAEISKMVGAPMGESEYYMIAELYFNNMEALQAAMSSPEGKAAAKDVMSFAGKIVSMHFAQVETKHELAAASACCG
jgi:uncharacterized protein (TIGR02118 family)